MANSRKLIVEVVGDTRKLDRSFKSVETRSQKLGTAFKRFGKAGAVGAGIAGTALLTKGLKDSVNAALEAEKAQTRLVSAFKSAGVGALGMARATQVISAVSRKAALDDEDLSDSLANLTRTTGSLQKGLRGIALAADIARARNISLGAATKIVEKAYVGQLRGLKSVGVQIGKNTTTTEALDRAQRKFAGSAEEFSSTTAAAQERLGVAFENLQEKIGAKLIPAITTLTIKATTLVDSIDKNWPRISEQIDEITASMRGAVAGTLALVEALKTIATVKIPGTNSDLFRLVKLLDKFSPGGATREALKAIDDVLNRGGSQKPTKTTQAPTPRVPTTPPRSDSADTSRGRHTQSLSLATLGGDVVVHTNFQVNEDVLARAVTRSQQKARRRNPPQKRGPNMGAGSLGG